MKYKFTINRRLPSLNDYINKCKHNTRIAAAFKKNWDNLICYEILSQQKGLQIKKPVYVHIHYIEENMKRDIDNIYSASKYILDALVKIKVLENDSPRYVKDVFSSHEYAKTSKVIVEIEEIE